MTGASRSTSRSPRRSCGEGGERRRQRRESCNGDTLQSSTVFEQASIGADGAFELFGFEPGVYRIHADTFQHSSEPVQILPVDVDAMIRHDGAKFPARWLATYAKGTVESTDGWDVATLPNVEAGQHSVCANGRCQTGIVTPTGSSVISLR
jgi:hypothetical protein